MKSPTLLVGLARLLERRLAAAHVVLIVLVGVCDLGAVVAVIADAVGVGVAVRGT